MDKSLAIRLIKEIAKKQLSETPVQLHVMGEPLLHPHLFSIIESAHQHNIPIRLFTNGALLIDTNRRRIIDSGIKELVIGIQTPSADTYYKHRRGKPDHQTYIDNIRNMVEAKIATGSAMQIELHYMNTLHFNTFRSGKQYTDTILPLVDDNAKAFAVIDEWKGFGREISAKYALGFEPRDLEGLSYPYVDAPLDCVRGNHCEVLPSVILAFKEIGTFCDYLVKPIRFVERYRSDCRSLNEQLAILANGDCTLCCVDYDGKMTVGNVRRRSLESIWNSKSVKTLQAMNDRGLFPTEVCRICRAFQVVDDYANKFPTREDQNFELVQGWYPLETNNETSFRWIGKRAIIRLTMPVTTLTLVVKHGHPNLNRTQIHISQGKSRQSYQLSGDSWQSIVFTTDCGKSKKNDLLIEADEFWIPADLFDQSEDRRELSIMVKDLTISHEPQH